MNSALQQHFAVNNLRGASELLNVAVRTHRLPALRKPLLGAGGLTPHSEPDRRKGLAEKLRQRRYSL
ncbi:hypothetical protein GCM10018790_46220 [Kitasatospora xanthocidica]|nr:hypothetical protein GCM10018790_46220 [Kitasatospora xanthocidica]